MKGPPSKKTMDTATRRKLVFGSTLGVAALLALALVLIVNYLAFRHYQRWDWTRKHLFTLSEKSRTIVKSLDRSIDVLVFMDDQSNLFPATKELLARYEAASPKVHVSFVDPQRDPARAQQLVQQYQIQRAAVVFESGKDKRVVEASDLADYDYSAMEMGGSPEMKGFKGEQKFTEAIVDLVEAKKPKILFTTGHGERSLDDPEAHGFGQLRRTLTDDGFAPEEWASLGKTAVPPGTDAVVVAGPVSAFAPPELEVLSSYLATGGHVLVMADPVVTSSGVGPRTALDDWLAGWGAKLDADIVIDPPNTVPLSGAANLFAGDYPSHPAVDALRTQRIPVMFSLVRSVRAGAAPKGAAVTELVKTSAEGWGETDLEHLDQVEKGPQDVAGPVSLGVAVELNAPPPPSPPADEDMPPPAPTPPPAPAGPQGRLVVLGDSDFVSNALLGQAGNSNLLTNSLNWMVQRKTHLGIAAKEPDQVHLSLTPQERLHGLLLVIFGLPGAALVAAIVVFVRRRR